MADASHRAPTDGPELPLAPAVSTPPAPGARLWLSTRLGRFFVFAVAAKATHLGLSAAVAPAPWLNALGVLVSGVLLVLIVWLAAHFFTRAKRRLLWRVRRKLILSYIFIGFVPVLLIVAFFLFAGLLMFFHVSAYLFKRGIDDVVDQAMVIAETTASELRRTPSGAAREVLERKLANSEQRYPGLSLALVPRPASSQTFRGTQLDIGAWDHVSAPTSLPDWVSVGGFGGLMAYPLAAGSPETGLFIRAVALPEERDPSWAVIVDLPVDERVLAQVREATGIDLNGVGVVPPGGDSPERPSRSRSVPIVNRSGSTSGQWAFNSVTIFDYTDWESGATGTLTLSIRVGIHEIYDRITAAQSRLGNLSLGELFMLALAAIAVLFLIIEVIALAMGFALAKSITGSIHELFRGTQRVQAQDFTHRITVNTRDQLGELADQFNEMTASIQDLLQAREEKNRLEEELRIAREIQMSLLPRGPLNFPGLSVTALCVPAREVGGDYYDLFALSGQRLGILIADVSGKGTSAALYMAELKGLMLSLSQIHESPRQLLVEVNRILAANLDTRSFITMTYAVVDVQTRTLTYARAGHTPLIHMRNRHGARKARALAPEGLVVGLRLEGIAEKFEQLLAESVVPLAEGDVFVLYTDGITEAMNADADLFGETRLLELVEEHADMSTDMLRERILRELEAFVGVAEQHDDMTMILVKVEAQPPSLTQERVAAGTAAARS